MVPELERWAAGDVLWLRRAAILAQLSFKGAAIDMPLLFRLIRPAMSDQTFWLRKAIGWGLRQAARDHAAEVLQFVRDNHASLSTLSRREALKHLGGDKGLAHVTTAAAAAAATSHDVPAGSTSTTKGRKRKAAAAAAE
jgi:3-methyladenine DNA glycosylase AlkD